MVKQEKYIYVLLLVFVFFFEINVSVNYNELWYKLFVEMLLVGELILDIDIIVSDVVDIIVEMFL